MGCCRAALLPCGCMGGILGRLMLLLPAAELRSSDSEPTCKSGSLALQGAEQPCSQRCLVQAKEGQARADKALYCRCPVVSPKELPQLLPQPGQQELGHRLGLEEWGRPVCPSAHPALSTCSSAPWLLLSEDKLFKAAVSTHRVPDGHHPASAQGALAPPLDPAPDTAKAKPVHAQHYIAVISHAEE